MPIDELMQTALDTEANQVTVPADEILQRVRGPGAGLRPAGHRPRWRLGRWLEPAAATLVLAGLVALVAARGPAGVAPGDGQGPPPSRGPIGSAGPAGNADSLNPHVAPPEPRVVVPPDLPAVTPPDGFLSQQDALERGMAEAGKGRGAAGGQLTLVDMQVAGDRWVLAFRGDGKAIAFGEGPGPLSPLADVSRVHLLGDFILELDGRTGEVYSIRETSMQADDTRGDLEHYRGRIVAGGAALTLRLVNADGTRDGRDLTVWAPQKAITAGGLAYWQLVYGTGRTLDVWGLTSAAGQVVAHRLAMPDAPRDERLTELDLDHGIPVHPQARATQEKPESGTAFYVEGADWQTVRDWYLEQMPRYGWLPMRGAGPPTGVVAVFRFGSNAWTWAEIRLEPAAEGTHLILTRGDDAAARPDPPPQPAATASAELSDVSFAGGQHGWLARGSTILATADGGRGWTPLYDTGAPGGVIYGVQRLDQETGWYATDAGLFRTRDGGKTWARILDASFLYGRFQFADGQAGWARTHPGGLKVTRDGGKTWTDVQYPCGDLLGRFHFINPASGWIVCPTGGGAGVETKQLFRTDDGGQSWRLIAETGPLDGPRGSMPLSSYSRDLFFLDARHGWLSTAKGDILATGDGGETWAALPRLGDVDEISAVQFLSPEQGYIIVTNRFEEVSRLLATADGGQTWTALFPERSRGT